MMNPQDSSLSMETDSGTASTSPDTHYNNGATDSDDAEEVDQRRRKIPKLTKKEIMDKYEKLTKNLHNHNSEANKGAATKLVLNHIDSLHNVYGSVQRDKNRDTKVHLKDAEVFKETSRFAATNARNIKFGDIGISISQKDFISNLKRYMAIDEANLDEEDEDGGDNEPVNNGSITQENTFNSYNWMKLGALYYQLSKKTMSNDFLYGPLATERRKPTARTRAIDDTKSTSATTAQQVQVDDISNNEEQNTAQMVKSIYQTFIQRNLDEKGINFFKFFINPHSFSQSVENLFFTSFLIKDARLKLFLNEDGIPIIQKISPEEHEKAQSKPADDDTIHHIATLDYNTWKGLIKTFNITESFLGHRSEIEDTIPEEDQIDGNEENDCNYEDNEDFE